MKIKQLLTKTLLVAAGLLVGANVWATTVYSFTEGKWTDEEATEWTLTTGTASISTCTINASKNLYFLSKDAANSDHAEEYYFTRSIATTGSDTKLTLSAYWFPGGASGGNKRIASLTFGDIAFKFQGQEGKCYVSIGGVDTQLGSTSTSWRNQGWEISATIDQTKKTICYNITINGSNFTGFKKISGDLSSYTSVVVGLSGDVNWAMSQTLKTLEISEETSSTTSHTYTINAVDESDNVIGSALASSTAVEDDVYSVYIPEVISDGSGNHYVLDDAGNANISGYYASYLMGTSNAVNKIKYTLDEDIVFFGEAENICTAQSNGKTSSNVSALSSGGGKYAQKDGSGYITLTFSAPSAGIYDIKVGMNNTNNKTRGFNYQLDGGTPSSTIEVAANTPYVLEINDQYLTAGDHTIQLNITYMLTPVFDYVLVSKDYVFTEVVGATDKTTTERYVKSSDIVMKPGDIYNVKFCNYGSDAANKNNFIVLINNTASMYADWYDYMQDKGSWAADGGFVNPSLSVINPYQMSTDGGTTSGNLDWANYGNVRNSFVDLTIKYKDGAVTVEGSATSIEDPNYIYYYGYSYTVADASADATVNLSVCLSWLGIVSVEKTAVGATIGATGWTTFASAYPLDLSGIEGAYYASAASGSSVTMTPTTATVRAGEGLALKGTKGATVTIPVAATLGDAIGDNKLVGCPTGKELTVNSNYYVLVNNGGTAEFQRLDTNGATIPAGKAYLNLTGVALASTLSIVFENEITGINEIRSQKEEVKGAYFNLAGQRVAQPTKGLYIVNGKKVVIK